MRVGTGESGWRGRLEEDAGEGGLEAMVWASVMASNIMRMERTTLSWMTARHDARSFRKA